MTDKTTVISFLLDETGSMQSIKDDTIGGFNAYLDGLTGDSPIEFTLVKFDSNKIEQACVGVPIADVERLNAENYRPGAMTPLIDAAYKTITATRDLVAKRDDDPLVIVVIQTDGHENASTEHTNVELAALIKELTAKGWQFVFLGAGIDAYDQAGKWGISQDTTVSYARAKSSATMDSLRETTHAYMHSGGAQAMSFSASQRQKMGEDKRPTTAKPKKTTTKIVDDLTLGE